MRGRKGEMSELPLDRNRLDRIRERSLAPLGDPDVHVEREDYDALIAQARAAIALRAQVAELTKEVERLTKECNNWRKIDGDGKMGALEWIDEIDRLKAELELSRPVVEAASEWNEAHELWIASDGTLQSAINKRAAEGKLHGHVDALESERKESDGKG